MGRTVVADESQLKSAESRLSDSAVAVEVGLTIGKLGGVRLNRDTIFALIPTPANEGAVPASLISENVEPNSKRHSKGKNSASAASAEIDIEWVVEHARQVSKMLVGGMYIVGIYLWAPESAFKNSTLALYQTLKDVARAVQVYANLEVEERLALHISYSPRRLSCWGCNVDEKFTPTCFRPCVLKTANVLSTLQTFFTTYNFNLRLPFSKHDLQLSRGLDDILKRAIALISQQLHTTKALLNGSLVSEDTEMSTAPTYEVELLLPFTDALSLQGNREDTVHGLLNFKGAIFAQAHVLPRETPLQAVEELKRDIITSLRSRLDILCDECEQVPRPITGESEMDKNDNKPAHPLLSFTWSESCVLVFPRRVLVPWLNGIFVCDYLQPKESFQDLRERCNELMSMELPLDSSAIQEPEVTECPPVGASFWSTLSSGALPSISKRDDDFSTNQGTSLAGQSFKLLYGLLSIGIILLAVLVAFLMMPAR